MWVDCGHLCFFRPAQVHNPNGKLIGSAVFAQLMAKCCRHIVRHRRIRLNLCTLALPGKYDWSDDSFGPSESTTQTADQSVQPFLHGWLQKVPTYTVQLALLSPKIAHSQGRSEPLSNAFLEPIRAHNPNGISISSLVFAQMTTAAQSVFILYKCNGTPLFPWKCPSQWRIWTPIYMVPGPTWDFNPNGISIGSAGFAGLTSVTDRQTTLLGR